MTKCCGRSAKDAQSNLDDSLRRLKTDRIDLWQFHEIVYDNDPDWIFSQGGAFEAGQRALKEGKVRILVQYGSERHPLLKDVPTAVELMSNEKQITKETPPTFLFHTDDDRVVPALNSALFYEALKRHGVPAELHIYAHGRHGVGLALNDPVLGTWPKRLEDWLKGRGLLTPAKP